jgi:hypothetical protein
MRQVRVPVGVSVLALVGYARQCCLRSSGKGMNEGFCVQDGEAYFENETDLIKYLREQNVDGNKELSDDFILAEAYQLEEYYYTEWDVEDSDYYYEEQADGTLIEINK